MKIEIFVALVAFFALTSGVFVPPRPGHKRQHFLESKECTFGPSYWCQNLTAAADCHAVKHCIQTVWIYKQLPPDTSSVCQTCLDMVKQARDELESNETQELIKEVFEGSCALLRIKPVVKMCDKIADQYIPDLIDTLASQMNPQMVCAVAGLCNNQKYLNQLIAEEGEHSVEMQNEHDLNPVKSDEDTELQTNSNDPCEGCHTVVGILETKFTKLSKDEVLQGLLQICGKTGSLSDACSNVIVTYFTEIYDHLKINLNAREVCLMSGECSAQFHTHATNVEITPISHIGYVAVGQGDDLPCDLCQQLVTHLRDLLVANTTESEFKRVLEGLCKQTKSFQSECLSIVDQYYSMIYSFLVDELKAKELCSMAGLCPANATVEQPAIMPLLPVESVQKALDITPASKQNQINMALEGSNLEIMQTPEQAQLPIDLLMPPHTQVLYNTETCVFCQYFLHYLQQVITSPKSEGKIKAIIDKACRELPSSINATCTQFVEMYEPALVAILAQEIDPSQVCPLIKVCPSVKDVKDVDVFMHQTGGDNAKCPMCLFAVSKLEQMVKDKKTEQNIKDALGKLCSHFKGTIAQECNDFVATYTDELVEMLIADLNPQEVCVYLKLCDARNSESQISELPNMVIGGDITSNLIPDATINGQSLAPTSNSLNNGAQCIMCEFVMREVQNQLKDNRTDSAIIATIHHICDVLPKSVGKECNDFVSQYGETVIQLLIQATVPSEVCRMMHLCAGRIHEIKVEIFDCAICEAVVYAIEKVLDNPKVDHGVDHVLHKACRALPKREQTKCKEIIDKYGRSIYDLVIHLANKGLVCKEVKLCAAQVSRPMREELLGADKCSRGPGFWCETESNANQCGEGAKKHCQDKVWLGKVPQ